MKFFSARKKSAHSSVSSSPCSDQPDSCPICFGRLKKPVSTECNHVFCRKCLFQAKQNQLTCPLCRGPLSPEGTSSVQSVLYRISSAEQRPKTSSYCLIGVAILTLIMIVIIVFDRLYRKPLDRTSGNSTVVEGRLLGNYRSPI